MEMDDRASRRGRSSLVWLIVAGGLVSGVTALILFSQGLADARSIHGQVQSDRAESDQSVYGYQSILNEKLLPLQAYAVESAINDKPAAPFNIDGNPPTVPNADVAAGVETLIHDARLLHDTDVQLDVEIDAARREILDSIRTVQQHTPILRQELREPAPAAPAAARIWPWSTLGVDGPVGRICPVSPALERAVIAFDRAATSIDFATSPAVLHDAFAMLERYAGRYQPAHLSALRTAVRDLEDSLASHHRIQEGHADIQRAWRAIGTRAASVGERVLAEIHAEHRNALATEAAATEQFSDRIVRTRREMGSVIIGMSFVLLIGGALVVLSIRRSMRRLESAVARYEYSEQRFDDVAANAGEYVWELSTDGTFQFATEPIARMLQRPMADIIGQSMFEFVPPASETSLRLWFAEVSESAAPLRQIEHALLRNDGETVWVRVAGVPMRSSDGALIGFRGTGLDITRERAAMLRANEVIHERIAISAGLNRTRDGILMFDAESLKYQHVNDAAVELLKYSREELHTMTPLQIMPDHTLASFRKVIDSLQRDDTAKAAHDDSILVRALHRKGDGREFPLEVVISFAPDAGPHGMFVSTVRDISVHVRAEREGARQREALDSIALVAVRSADGHFLSVNDRFCATLGYTRADLCGKHESILDSGVHGEAFHHAMHSTLSQRQPWHGEIRYRCRHHANVWIDLTIHPLEDEHGEITRYLMIGLDITARKTAAQRMTMAMRASRIGVWDWNQVTNEASFSDEYFTMLGYEAGAYPMSWDTWKTLTHPDDYLAARKLLEQHFSHAIPTFRMDIRMRCRDGQWKWVHTIGEVVERNPAGDPMRMVGVHIDIHDRKSAEQRSRKAQQKAESADLAKSAFIANMSHEIRTPMTAILGYTDLLLNDDVDTDQTRHHLNTVQQSGEHLLSILDDILDYSKIDAGQMHAKRSATSPVKIVRDVVELMRARAELKGLELEASFDTPMPRTVTTDPMRVRQILMNIIGNAVKFTKSGRIHVRASIEEDASPTLRIDVIDTGIGINPSRLGGLFEAFQQADRSIAHRFGGTGLGLRISRRLANMLDGDITVASVEGRGSTFTMRVDAGPLDGIERVDGLVAWNEAALQRREKPVAVDLTGRTVLVVEDGPDNQHLIAHCVRSAGARVVVADNGLECIAMMDKNTQTVGPIDLILMDMEMPEIDGYTATRALRSSGSNIPIVALTANAMADDHARCLEAGCDAYLSKPFVSSQLLQLIHDLTPQQASARVA
jgi:two-component system CheB/CheR fusion protein